MTDCEHAAEWISAQLDGELPPAELARLEAHLEQCPSCRALQKDLLALHQALLEAAAQWQAEPPADLTQRVLERVREANAVPFRAQKNRWKRWASLAAMLTMVVIGGIALSQGQGGTSSGGAAESSGAQNGGAGILLAATPQGDGSPQADCAVSSAGGEALPESASTPNPEERAKEAIVTGYSGEGGEPPPTSAAQSPQSRAAEAPEDIDVLPANALDICPTSGEVPGDTGQSAQGCTVYDVPMTITINGTLFCETDEGLDGAEGTTGADVTLPKGYEPLGQLTSDTEVSPQDGLQLYANFSASGTVYANAEEPDHIYVWMDAEWFSGIVRFDLASTDGE